MFLNYVCMTASCLPFCSCLLAQSLVVVLWLTLRKVKNGQVLTRTEMASVAFYHCVQIEGDEGRRVHYQKMSWHNRSIEKVSSIEISTRNGRCICVLHIEPILIYFKSRKEQIKIKFRSIRYFRAGSDGKCVECKYHFYLNRFESVYVCVCVRNGLINSCPFRVLFVSLMVDLCRMPITQVSLGNILTILLRQRVHDKRKFRLFVFSFANIDRHFKCDAVHSQNIRTANKLSPKQKKRKEKLCVKSNQSSFCSDNFFFLRRCRRSHLVLGSPFFFARREVFT